MTDPFDPRLGDAPSERAVDAYVAGDAEPDERAAVEGWMALDPANAAIVEARRSGFAAFPEARPDAMLARIRQGLDAAEVAEREAAAPPPQRLRWPRWLAAGAGLIAAAAAALIWVDRPPVDDGVDAVQVKGSLALRVFRARGDAVVELGAGDAARAHDRLRFRPEGVPPGGHLLVAGVEADGDVFAYFPPDGRAVAAETARGDDGALPGAAVLDDSEGREHIWLVWCPAPFTVDRLRHAGERLVTPAAACQTAGLPLVKE